MKKKFITFLFCLLIAASVFSSGKKETVIGCAAYKYEDPFISGMRAVISEQAGDKAKIIFGDGLGLQLTQNDQLDEFFNDDVDSIIVNIVDRSAVGAVIKKAEKKDIPLVFINREPYPSDMYYWVGNVYYVGSIASDSGYMQGQMVAEYWKSHPEADINNDGILQYVILKGESGNQDSIQRSEYCIKALSEEGIASQKLDSGFAQWSRVKAQNIMTNMLSEYGDNIEAVFSNNDEMALGAIDALKIEGYFSEDKYIPVVGCDASSTALKAIQDGTLLGTVLNDSYNQAKAAFNLAYVMASDEEPTSDNIGYTITNNKYVWIPYEKVTKENFMSFYAKSKTL